jgi:hypothetical protein
MSGSPLVSADRLAAELASATPPVLLDCRWQLAGGSDPARTVAVGDDPGGPSPR